jgi:pyruvate carboxylase
VPGITGKLALSAVVHEESELEDAFHRAKSEAEKSFGNSEIYIERYIALAKDCAAS